MKIEKGSLIQIPVSIIEYREGGNTLWVHSPDGATVLRIKMIRSNTIESKLCDTSPVSHADLSCDNSLCFCLGPKAIVNDTEIF